MEITMRQDYMLRWVLGGLFFCFPFVLTAQIDWTPLPANPVINSTFDLNADELFRPSVVFDGTLYHMWYGKLNTEGDGDEKMGYATSPDGLLWTLVKETVLSHSDDPEAFDYIDASQGWVISDGDTLKMWYWGNGLDIGNIGYAWSLDGIEWTKVAGSGTDGSIYDKVMDGSEAIALATPSVVKKDGVYHLWYTRAAIEEDGLIYRIGYAVSLDGLNWVNQSGSGTNGAVFDVGEAGSFDEGAVSWPTVIATENGFAMWYSGVDAAGTIRLGYATSSDGVNWVRVSGNGTNGAVFDQAHFPYVLSFEEGYKMWYGIDGENTISYAVSGLKLGVEDNEVISPLALHNYPNPFVEKTTISFRLSAPSKVRITLYNLLGNIEKVIVSGYYPAGEGKAEVSGGDLVEGVYIYEVETGSGRERGKMQVVK